MNIAQKVRREREQHPERFCSRCLWRIVSRRTGESTPCPKHPRELPDAPTKRRLVPHWEGGLYIDALYCDLSDRPAWVTLERRLDVAIAKLVNHQPGVAL